MEMIRRCQSPMRRALVTCIMVFASVIAQAEEYGHDVQREFSFLIVHSLLHLCGYDHMEDSERLVMEEKQENILNKLGITREI